MGQSPIKVNEETKERVRYLAALVDTTQADVVDRAVQEYAVRHADLIEKGIDRPDRSSPRRRRPSCPPARPVVRRRPACLGWSWTARLTEPEPDRLVPGTIAARPVIASLKHCWSDVVLQ